MTYIMDVCLVFNLWRVEKIKIEDKDMSFSLTQNYSIANP